jgi:haloalkane dehalogenase
MSDSADSIEASWRRVYPFESHWMEMGGERLHYLDEGLAGESGGTLLFVHGNPTWSFHWRRLVAALRGRFRCVAVDHLGCGLSDKPRRLLTLEDHIANLCALVEKLELDRVTLVAQDWGGAIGLGAMLRMRERLARIVLFNTGAFPPRYIPWRIRVCRWPVIGRLAVQGVNAFSRAALRMTLARRSGLELDVAAGYLAPYDSWSNRRAVFGFVKDIPRPRRQVSPKLESEFRRNSATWGEFGRNSATWDVLAQIEHELPALAGLPSCLIWGMRDWCFRPDCLERFVEAWPRAEVHRLADVGHWVVEDAPEESLAIVESFLDSSDQSYHDDATGMTRGGGV